MKHVHTQESTIEAVTALLWRRVGRTCLGLPEKGDSPRLGGISSMSGLMKWTSLSSMASYSGYASASALENCVCSPYGEQDNICWL